MTILGTSWLNHVQIRVLCDHISVEPSVSTIGTVRYLRILRQTIGDNEWKSTVLHYGTLTEALRSTFFLVSNQYDRVISLTEEEMRYAAEILTSFHFMISLMCRYSK